MLRQVIYRSRSLIGGWGPELLDIARASARRNEAAGICSTLYHDEQMFCQVIEGPFGAVEALMASLKVDPRHFSLRMASDAPIHRHSDGAAAMRFVDGRHAKIARRMVQDEAFARAAPREVLRALAA